MPGRTAPSYAYVLKRMIDLAACLVAAPVAIPVCLLLLVLIRIESPGSPLFVQARVGRHERIFRMVKLRTMTRGAHVPSHEVEPGRITRVGSALRRFKLDELPQLWNVLIGEMSLVGPRPCLSTQVELIELRKARGLFDFLPGVSGPAQLMNVDMSQPARMVEIEADYFARASAWSDIRILLRTIFGGGMGDPARWR